MDNVSIYTKNLTDFLNEKNIFFEKQTPQLLDLDSLGNYDSVILSGRKKMKKRLMKSILILLFIQLKTTLNYLEFVMVQKS